MTRRVVLVTGASGFIGGRTLAPLRAAGFEVHAFGRHAPGMQGVAHHPGDLVDRERVRAVLRETRSTHVLHCAWYVAHGAFWQAPDNLDWVAATLLLARDAMAAGALRFVGVGSCAEYDWSDGGVRPRRETDPTCPSTLYGEAKDATRRLLASACEGAGVGFAWARVFHLFGEGEPRDKLVSSIAGALVRAEPAVCRQGQLVRDILPVEEVGRAVAALVASDVTGPVNIGSGQGASLGDLARDLAAITGRPDLLGVAEEPAAGSPARMIADVGRLVHEVGYRPDPDLSRPLATMVRAIEMPRP